MKILAAFYLSCFLCISCCLSSIEIKPEMSALDLKTAQAGKLSVSAKFMFKDCCPTKQQENIALQIQQKIAELFDKVVRNEISLASYNEKVQAASNAIEKVVLVCKSRTVGMAEQKIDSEREAWNQLLNVLKMLEVK